MAKAEQILVIEPQYELKFRGPFTSSVTSFIKLTNPSENKVCFKIKTTAPKKYCVRPNSGVLDPQSRIEIAVTLQPFDFDPHEKNKHKFMVQSIVAPGDDFNLETLWKEASPDTLMDSKLKCVFEMPSEINSLPSNFPVTEKEELKEKESSNTANSVESELQKASNEIARLREDLSLTQRENLQLKEDLLKVRQQQVPIQSTLNVKKTNQPSLLEGTQVTPVIYLAFGVILGLLSIFIGKFIF